MHEREREGEKTSLCEQGCDRACRHHGKNKTNYKTIKGGWEELVGGTSSEKRHQEKERRMGRRREGNYRHFHGLKSGALEMTVRVTTSPEFRMSCTTCWCSIVVVSCWFTAST